MADIKPWEEDYSTPQTQAQSNPWDENYNAPPAQQAPLNPIPQFSKPESAIAGFGQGGTFGFGDEISGGIGTAADLYAGAKNYINPEWGYSNEGKSVADLYRENRDYSRKYNAQAQQEHPWAYGVGEVSGGIATTAMTGGLAEMSAPALIGRGAVEGAIQGAGTSGADLTQGEVGQFAKDVGKGTVIGAAIPAVVKGAGTFFKTPEQYAQKGVLSRLEATPVERQKLGNKGVNTLEVIGQDANGLPVYKTTNVEAELPNFLKSPNLGENEWGQKFGPLTSVSDLEKTMKTTMDTSSKSINKVATDFDEFFDKMAKLETTTVKEAPSVQIGKEMVPSLEIGIKKKESMAQSLADMTKEKIAWHPDQVANEIEGDLMAKIQGVPGYETTYAKLQNYAMRLRQLGTDAEGNKIGITSLEELQNFRRQTDKLIDFDRKKGAEVPLFEDALKTVRNDIYDHIQSVMLPAYDKLKQGLVDKGLADRTLIGDITDTAKTLRQANYDYRMASEVEGMVNKTISRDKRKEMGLTDWIAASGIGGAGALAHGATGGIIGAIGGIAAKKAGEWALPRAQQYAPELMNVINPAARAVREPFTQRRVEQNVSKPTQAPVKDFNEINQKVQGTPYGAVFQGKDPDSQAIAHYVLFNRDPNYRKIMEGEETA